MNDLQTVANKLAHNALIQNIDTVSRGHIRIATGFMYPDGSSIDVFVKQPQQNELPELATPVLTDFGTTWSWLQDFNMRPDKTAARKKWFNSILSTYDCVTNGAAIEYELETLDDLPVAIIRLGQACLRSADLIYSKRYRAQSSFNYEVENVISEVNENYITDAEIPLNTGNVIKVDFCVPGKNKETAIQTLSTGNSQYAHHRANEIYVRWDEILGFSDWPERGNQCVTIFDDSTDVYDRKDLNRLERKSILLPFSDTTTLNDVLEAA